jgi:hypothetical protein
VRHLSDGALRRLYDEPYALDEATRAHYNGCQACRDRMVEVATDAREAHALMAVPGATVNPAQALARLKARRQPSRARWLSLGGRGWRRPVLAGATAAVIAGGLVASLAFTPMLATITQIFQPTQVTPVTITRGDMAGLNAFSNWGDVKGYKTPSTQQVETAQEAAQTSGLPAITFKDNKALTAAGVAKAPVTYFALGSATGSVTFNANAPAKIRGTTLTLDVGTSETAVYGDLSKLVQNARAAAPAGETAKPGAATGDTSGTPVSGQGLDAFRNLLAASGPILAVVEMNAPKVSSDGAGVADIKSTLLAQPGLSQPVRQAISSIDNPAGNLPIPIPAGLATSHQVRVQGGTATAVGDNTGLGAAVIWIKGNKVYAVVGTVPVDQVVAVANSLS